MLDRGRGATERQLQVAERLDRPDPVGAHAELRAHRGRLSRVLAATGLAALTCLEPRQSGERGRKLCPLARLPREANGLVVARLGGGPLVRRRLVAGDVMEEARQDADCGERAGARERAIDQAAASIGFT